jgi:GT2 family glycosyltransferase
MSLRETMIQPVQKRAKIAIIMVNYNGKNLLKTAIDSIVAKTTYPNYQLILVDNGSTDGSVEFIKKAYPWITLICNAENRGYAEANNQGIRASKAKYYLLLNTDIEIYTKGWLTRLVDIIESDKTVGIVTCWRPLSEKTIDSSRGPGEQVGPPYEVKFAAGAVFLIKGETIDNIGLMDEIFTPCYFEDADWCDRALSAGWKILLDPSTVVIHYTSVTTKKVFAEISRYYYIYARNRIIYEMLNHSMNKILDDLLEETRDLGAILFVGSASERMLKIRSWVRAHREVFCKFRQILEKRRTRKLIIAPFLCAAIP